MIAIDEAPTQPTPDEPTRGGAAGARPRRPGIRLGPFVFVPELLTTPGDDPWATRKGEPRIFALLWCTYLMIAALVTIFSVRFLGIPNSGEYRGACVMMCVLGGIGVAALWPALRLGQSSPKWPMRSVLIDAMVVALPLQAVIWPMPMLTDWSFDLSMAVGILLAGWSLVTGAVIAWGYLSGRRVAALALSLGLMLLAPALMLRGGLPSARAAPPEWGVLSPITAPWTLSWAASGMSPGMSADEWRMVTIPPVAGIILLTAAGRTRPRAR